MAIMKQFTAIMEQACHFKPAPVQHAERLDKDYLHHRLIGRAGSTCVRQMGAAFLQLHTVRGRGLPKDRKPYGSCSGAGLGIHACSGAPVHQQGHTARPH